MLAIQYGLRNKKLKNLGYKNYQDFLKSDTWSQIRERFHLKNIKKNKACFCCGSREYKLIPHHIKYGGLNKIKLGGIVPVCGLCHQMIHDYHKEHMNISIKQATRKIKRKWDKLKQK